MSEQLGPDPERTTRFEFNSPEGKGVVEVEEGPYGPYIWVNGQCLCLIDLFYFSENGQEAVKAEAGYPAIVFYQPGEDDALGSIKWKKDKTTVLVERNDPYLKVENHDHWWTEIHYKGDSLED
jgi:hypothetical protein